MKNTSNDTKTNLEIDREMEKVREEFLKTVDVKVLDNTQNTESFSAIIDSRRGIVIK